MGEGEGEKNNHNTNVFHYCSDNPIEKKRLSNGIVVSLQDMISKDQYKIQSNQSDSSQIFIDSEYSPKRVRIATTKQ